MNHRAFKVVLDNMNLRALVSVFLSRYLKAKTVLWLACKREHFNFPRASAAAKLPPLERGKQITSQQMFEQLFKHVSVNIRCKAKGGGKAGWEAQVCGAGQFN